MHAPIISLLNMLNITNELDTAESIPDWDLQAFRRNVNIIASYQTELTTWEMQRFRALCDRFKRLLRQSVRGREDE